MGSGDILSDEESAALRDSVATDDAAPAADADGVRSIEPDYWDRIRKDRAPALESIAERLVSRLTISGRRFFRRVVEVASEPATMVRWGSYMRKLPAPSSLHELDIKPLGLRGAIILDAAFVHYLVDRFFGGDGLSERPSESSEFTPMESRLTRRFVETLVLDIQESWQPLVDLQFSLGRSDSNPLFLAIAADSDTVSLTRFDFHIDDRRYGFVVALPAVLIEPMQFVRPDNRKSVAGKSIGWHSRIREDVKEAKVSLRAVLAQTEVTLRDLARIRPGDVIPIEAPHVVTLVAGDQPIVEGSLGVIRESNAVRITGKVNRQSLGEQNG